MEIMLQYIETRGNRNTLGLSIKLQPCFYIRVKVLRTVTRYIEHVQHFNTTIAFKGNRETNSQDAQIRCTIESYTLVNYKSI